MKIKELAYSAQQHLQSSTGGSFKRAHIYELLAASFGFNSYAAFGGDNVLTQNRNCVAWQSALIERRCIELGYQPGNADLASAALQSFLAEHQIGVASISALITQLRGGSSSRDDDLTNDAKGLLNDDRNDLIDSAGDGGFAPIMLDGLEAAASKGNALAHYALALINAPGDDEDKLEAGSSYWHSQGQQGRVLSGVEREWAEAHAAQLTKAEKYTRHLREAGRLGNQHALLDLADRFDDPSFFEQPRRNVGTDPSAVAAIAERMGRAADAKHWLTVAAESGDTDAMLQLIEGHDRGDLLRCWMWVYLAQLVGADLIKDARYAINEDGSDYDDDVGGPAYVAGRDGIDLDPLSSGQDATAWLAAKDLFAQIQRVGEARQLP
jgi:hypothetical protein